MGLTLQNCCYTRTDLGHKSRKNIHEAVPERPFIMRTYKLYLKLFKWKCSSA